MDYVLLKDFFANYSLPVLIIALSVGLIKFIFDKFFSDKIFKPLWSYLPFALCTVIYIAYDMLFVLKAFAFNAHSLYAGVLSGSLSVVFSSALKKIDAGKPLNVSQTVLLIEGMLHGFISENLLNQTAIELEKVLSETPSEQDLSNRVANTIKTNAYSLFSDDDLMHLALLIIQSVKSLKSGNKKA